MSQTLSITIQRQLFSAELNDCPVVQRLPDALPLKLGMSRWGDEYYGDCDLAIALDDRALLITGC